MGRITLWGWYTAFPDLFDNVPFPASLDKTVFLNLLMERSGMLFTFTQQPDYLKQNINGWFTRYSPLLTRMSDALDKEYDPIENYDRQEEWTDTPDVSYTKTGGNTVTDVGESAGNTEMQVSAFNDTVVYSPDHKQVNDLHDKHTIDTEYNSEQTKESGTRSHKGRVHGNIGVTTNQQMIQSELELRKFDIYSYAVNLFEHDLLMQVY